MRIGIAQHRYPISEALRRALALRPGHDIAWIARNGAQALEECAKLRPDLLLLELTLPIMQGIEVTRRIMSTAPCAILIVTCGVSTQAADIFRAMGYGALDALDTLLVNRNSIAGVLELRKRIDAVAALLEASRSVPGIHSRGDGSTANERGALIVIGASAGGPAALAGILHELPADLPATLLIVQHIRSQLARSMAEWLRGHTRLPVRVAAENDALEPGIVLLARPNGHLTLKRPDRVGYTPDPRALYQPSIDMLFESVNTHWPGKAAGVLLTGIGRDGAAGLKSMRSCGYYTIAQDRSTSAVYGMPAAAIGLGAAADVLPLELIAARLIEFCGAATTSPHSGATQAADRAHG